jgi:hypothetical protein
MALTSTTYQIAMAAGRDAGNRSAMKAGRATWNDEDAAAALRTFEALYALAVDEHCDNRPSVT